MVRIASVRPLVALSRRFATPSSRFRLAVTCGFSLVAVGTMVLGVNAHSGIADSIWGAMGLIGGQTNVASSTVASERAAPLYERQHLARRHGAKVHLASADGDDAAPVSLGRRSMCVRLCDGFAFPVGAYHGDEDIAAHEATCHSECPGAQTALFVLPAGSDSMDDATQARTGRNYSALPVAFHYTTVLSDACTCHPASGNRIKSLLHDFTLRKGDAVMTVSGLKVFHGGANFPYRRTDFVALAQSRDVSKQNRVTFHAIEQASYKVPAVKAPQGAPDPTRTAVRTKALEHQASLTPAQ